MSFISLYFFLFLFIVIFVYFVMPKRFRWIVLLIASYVFYLLNDLRAVIFLVTTTVSIYLAAIGMRKLAEKQNAFFEQQDEAWLNENKREYQKKLARNKKLILTFTLIFNFGILFMLKYFSYLADAFCKLIKVQPLNLNILLPLGISFYMFQTIGYLIDVYFGKVQAETNVFKVALFTSFFPQLIQGPISRYDQLAPQLYDGNDFNKEKLKSGALLMLWGYFKKLVIADRAGILYASIMQNYTSFQGAEVFVGMLCFVIKLYCDFSGGIDIAMGTAECLGIDLTPNFKRPFFATSVIEYWKRWHITLGAWMKDYVLYPLTMSKGYNKFIRFCRKTFKKGVAGRVIPAGVAMFFVFLLVGIWHGPNLTYLLFGVYNGIIILIETIIKESRKIKKIEPKERSNSARRLIYVSRLALTFILVYFGKYLSAAPDVATAGAWFVATFKYNSANKPFYDFLGRTNFNTTNTVILVVSFAILICVEILQERGGKIREYILTRNKVLQWVVFYLLIIAIVLFTAYSKSGGGFAYEVF